MDTNQLLAFISVAESGSFSLAAEKLHLTQPAVSKRIATLEQILDTKLFDRVGKRIILTEAGEILLPDARKLLNDLNNTRTSIENLSAAVTGRLRIGSSHHIGLHRIPPVLKAYTNTYPDVITDITFVDSEEAYSQVLHGELEIAVVTLSPHRIQEIQATTLWTDPLCFMASIDHPLAKLKSLQLDDLLEFPVILPAMGTFTRQVVDEVFTANRLSLQVEMSTNYLETIKMMVTVGMAWSVLPKIMHDKQLSILPLKQVNLNRQLGYIYRQDRELSNAGKAFIELLKGNQG